MSSLPNPIESNKSSVFNIRQYSIADIENSVLNIHLYQNWIVLSIINIQKNELTGLVQYNFTNTVGLDNLMMKLKGIKSQEELLNFNFKFKNIILCQVPSFFIPVEFFEEEQIDNIYKTYFSNSCEIYEHNTFSGVVNIYGMSKRSNSIASEMLSEFKWNHTALNLYKVFKKSNFNSNESRVYLHIQEGSILIYVLHDIQLIYFNSFPCPLKEDVLYFVMSVYEQLHFNVESNKLILSGWIEKNDDLYALLYSYIKEISFLEFYPTIKIPSAIPSSQYNSIVDMIAANS